MRSRDARGGPDRSARGQRRSQSPPRPASRARLTERPDRRQGHRFAKISTPQLHKIHPRHRIWRLLDEARNHRAIWISAPAGFGKTTAVASWLRTSRSTPIWYNCDAGDADAASFFHFLALALPRARGGARQPLPTLAAELQAALPTFARNFFRTLCARLRSPTILVFDNFQDIPDDAPLHALLPTVIDELNDRLMLIVLSRVEPAPGLIRLRSSGTLATIGRSALQLDLEETEALVNLYAGAQSRPEVAAAELYRLTLGWAAGVAILLRADRKPYDDKGLCVAPTQETFDYLAAEVFERLDAATRAFLLTTAALEGFTGAVAARISLNPGAADLLERLVRVNAFTERRPESLTYHYHPLFRGFLLREALRRHTDQERAALHARAASALLEAGELEQALAHFLEAGERDRASGLALQLAPMLIEQGRFRTALGLIASLGIPESRPVAWLLYWEGVACMTVDFPRSRSTLERAYREFVSDADDAGQLLAAATILQQILVEFDDYRRMLPWLDILEGLLDREPRFATAAIELSVLAGALAATTFGRPRRDRIETWRDRIESLLRSERDALSRTAAASVLVNYCAVSGELARMRPVLAYHAPAREQIAASPAALAHLLWMQSFLEFMGGNLTESHALLARATELVRHHGLPRFEVRCQIARLQTLDYETNTEEIETTLERLEAEIPGEPALVRGNFAYLRGVFRLAQGRLDAAATDLSEADEIADANGYLLIRAIMAVDLGLLACERGNPDAAREHLARSATLSGGLGFPLHDFHRSILAAEIARRAGAWEQFLPALRSALAIAREQGFANSMHGCNLALRRLMPHALEHRIEHDHCRWLIRVRRWTPPASDAPFWPWPVRIRTLGGFDIELDGQPYRVRRKQQRRPVALLKTLAAHSKGLSRAALTAELWPRFDRVSMQGALDMAIHRLRRLLNRPDAVLVENGRVSLNPAIVTIDARVFERWVAEPAPAPIGPDDLSRRATRLCALYCGRFLPDESSPAIERTRDRLHRSFVRQVLALGTELRSLGAWRDLELLYEHAAELEPLGDEIHASLIEALIAQEKIGAAQEVYSRYRMRLARSAGASPSRSMQRLLQRLP